MRDSRPARPQGTILTFPLTVLHMPADPGGGEGAVPGAEGQARHAQVRPHLPRQPGGPGSPQVQGQGVARAGCQGRPVCAPGCSGGRCGRHAGPLHACSGAGRPRGSPQQVAVCGSWLLVSGTMALGQVAPKRFAVAGALPARVQAMRCSQEGWWHCSCIIKIRLAALLPV